LWRVRRTRHSTDGYFWTCFVVWWSGYCDCVDHGEFSICAGYRFQPGEELKDGVGYIFVCLELLCVGVECSPAMPELLVGLYGFE